MTAQNTVLCHAKQALHKPTAEGHDRTKQTRESKHRKFLRLDEAVELCRICHQQAPFCFYNGNTFASIITLVIKQLDLPADKAFVVRSLAGHIVAGVATSEEKRGFQDFCRSLDDPPSRD